MTTADATLARRLLEPARYPHPTRGIQHIETHLSHVFLTGDFAYKIKKPLDLGFANFSTLALRQSACEDELRLNRRLAPQLYLEVVPITGTADDPQIGGAGPPIEYAVKMREFGQEALASHALGEGRFGAREVDALALRVAAFHRDAPIADAASPLGHPDEVRRFALDNFGALRSIGIDAGADLRRLDALAEWTAAEFDRHAQLFAARHRDGFVRECHGDLHLDNIVLIGGAPVPFDCIEFNAALRWIDVISEIVFVAMDLDARGRLDLSHRFVNAALEASGDYAGLAVARFYMVYRAMVRAKVTGIRVHQGSEESRAEHHRYLALALRETRPDRPAIILTHGFSGAGKTTLSQPLVESLGAIRVRSDVERKRLHGLTALDRTDAPIASGLYSTDASRATYDRLAAVAVLVANAGYRVIVDATFLTRADRDRFHQLASERRWPFAIIDFVASESTLHQRVLARASGGRDASDADLAVLAHQFRTAEPIADDEQSALVTVDTELPAGTTMIDGLRKIPGFA